MKRPLLLLPLLALAAAHCLCGCRPRTPVAIPGPVFPPPTTSSARFNTNRTTVGIRSIHETEWALLEKSEPATAWEAELGPGLAPGSVDVERWIGDKGNGHEKKSVVRSASGNPLHESDFYRSGRTFTTPEGKVEEIVLVVVFDWTHHILKLHYLNDPLDATDPLLPVAASNTVQAAEFILNQWGPTMDEP